MVFAILVGAGLMWVVLDIFVAGRKGAHAVTASLEVNESLLDSFRSLTADIRASRDVESPAMAAPGTPPPDFAWTSAAQGTHRLVLSLLRLDASGGGLVPVLDSVEYFLDDPVQVGNDRSWTLYRVWVRREADMGAAPNLPGTAVPTVMPQTTRREKIAEGIRELVFHRVETDLDRPQPGTGPRNLYLRMRTARERNTPEGKSTGYEVLLETTVHLRGAP